MQYFVARTLCSLEVMTVFGLVVRRTGRSWAGAVRPRSLRVRHDFGHFLLLRRCCVPQFVPCRARSPRASCRSSAPPPPLRHSVDSPSTSRRRPSPTSTHPSASSHSSAGRPLSSRSAARAGNGLSRRRTRRRRVRPALVFRRLWAACSLEFDRDAVHCGALHARRTRAESRYNRS